MHHILIFLLIIFTVTLEAQDCGTVKGSAFERTTISGKAPRKILDETGTQVEVPMKNQSTLFIYIEANRNCNMKSYRIWIDGKPFALLQEEVTQTPIIIQNAYPGGIADTLVRKTVNKVFRLEPKQELKVSPGKKIRKQLSESKILVEYSYNAGTGSCIIKDIKKLAPLVLQ